MELQASFSVYKHRKAYLATVRNLHGDGTSMMFQFDTGASISLIGLNTICGNDKEQCDLLERMVREEIQFANVAKYDEPIQTITREQLSVYPCRCEYVSIQESQPFTFYFYIYLGQISLPLLGFDYIDDCAYQHSICGDLVITAVSEDVGKRFYPENVINFNKVMKKYLKQAFG